MKKIITLLLVLMMMTTLSTNFVVHAQGASAYSVFEAAKCDSYLDIKHSNGVMNIDKTYVGAMWPGDYLLYKDVVFEVAPAGFEVVLGTVAPYTGSFEVRADAPDGTLLAKINVVASDWSPGIKHTADIITAVTGVHNIYLICTSQTANVFSFRFKRGGGMKGASFEYRQTDMFDDIADNKYKYQIQSMASLGLLTAYKNNNYDPNIPITRGDMAVVVYNLLNGTPTSNDVSAFSDISDKSTTDAVNYLYNSNIISASQDGLFRPTDFITTTDALVMITRALGYENYAKALGGYPYGYLSVAAKENLSKAVSTEDIVRRDILAALLYNATNANYMELSTIGGETVEYKAVKGILSKTKEIYKGTGVVVVNPSTGLYYPKSDLSKSQVAIEKEIFDIGQTDAANLIGMKCEYFYKQAKDDTKTLIAIYPSSSVKQLVITSEKFDITELDENGMTYVDKNDKENTVRFQKNVSVIYNGKAIEKMIDISDFRGKMRLIDNGGGYQTIVIDKYKNIIIGGVDTHKQKIYDSLSGDYIPYVGDDLEGAIYKNDMQISLLEMSDIKVGDVAMVYESVNTVGNRQMRIVIITNQIEGTIDELTNNNEVLIKDEKYAIAIESKKAYNLGLNAIFKLNSYNELMDYELKENQTVQIGCMIDYKKNAQDLDQKKEIKILTKDSIVKIFTTSDKFLLDGQRVQTVSEMKNKLTGLTLKTPIRYLLNEKNEIIMLDTYLDGTKDTNDTMTKLSQTQATYIYRSKMLINTDGVAAFPITADAALISFSVYNDDNSAFMSKVTNVLTGTKTASGDIFSTKRDTMYGDIFVRYNGGVDLILESPTLIDKVTDKINTDGDTVPCIYGYIGNSYVDFELDNTWLKGSVMAQSLMKIIEKGDFIKFSLNEKGRINGFEFAYFHNGIQSSSGIAARMYNDLIGGVSGDSQQEDNFTYGTVVAREGATLKISRKSPDSSIANYAYTHLDTANILLVDQDTQTPKIIQNLGADNVTVGSKILIWNSNGIANTIIIYGTGE